MTKTLIILALTTFAIAVAILAVAYADHYFVPFN